MDWIKQIIECKKGNWESPGSLGQKIKKIRMLRRYTQKELGVMCGFSLSSADVRIAQYEKNKKIPREKILKAMCNALGVGEGALVHADDGTGSRKIQVNGKEIYVVKDKEITSFYYEDNGCIITLSSTEKELELIKILKNIK